MYQIISLKNNFKFYIEGCLDYKIIVIMSCTGDSRSLFLHYESLSFLYSSTDALISDSFFFLSIWRIFVILFLLLDLCNPVCVSVEYFLIHLFFLLYPWECSRIFFFRVKKDTSFAVSVGVVSTTVMKTPWSPLRVVGSTSLVGEYLNI